MLSFELSPFISSVGRRDAGVALRRVASDHRAYVSHSGGRLCSRCSDVHDYSNMERRARRDKYDACD